jgi:LysR family transcriptional regulator, glycine cleavage system transcriptional activator
MTLHQLKVFQAVSQHLNITKASKELRISQPSVFQQVKFLEDSYGTKLYRKTGRGIELTEEGRLFRLEVEEILRRVDSLEKKFAFSLVLLRVVLSSVPLTDRQPL